MKRHTRPRVVRLGRIVLRRQIARLDRTVPGWAEWLPSWGTSLALHGLVLFLLALMIYRGGGDGADRPAAPLDAQLGDSLGEDVVSLIAADRGGDPFTELESDLSPSLSIEVPDPDTSTPALPDLGRGVRFAPDFTAPDLPPTALVLPGLTTLGAPADAGEKIRGRSVPAAMHAENLSAPFSGRSGATKGQLLRREGGTAQSEKAVQQGLDWLARHQRGDGGWSLDYHGQCVGEGCPPEQPLESDAAATGLALLPFLGAGHKHNEDGPHKELIHRGIAWIVNHQDADGNLYVGSPGQPHLYSHAIATMALCEAYGISRDKRLRDPAQRALNYLARAQNPVDGGWRYSPGMAGDTSVLGWCMMALRSGRLAGLNVSKRTLRGCQVYLDMAAADPRKMTYGYRPGRGASPVMTAEALLCRQYLGWPRNHPALAKAASLVAADLERTTERNIYYWYYATQMLHNLKGPAWERWNGRVREWLIGTQAGDGCARGSWDPRLPEPDRWGSSGGRLYVTALSVLTLEVYYRFLPLYAETAGPADVPPPDDEAKSEPEPDGADEP